MTPPLRLTLRLPLRALVCTAALGLAAAAPLPAAAFELPAIDRIVNYQPKLPLQVFTADGVEIAQFGVERRQYLPLAQTPRRLVDALLAVEDARFREHGGIDPRGMARAALAMLTGGRRQGASTLTQQLVRTMLLTHQFTAERKAKEILLALRVEEALSKDRILEIYLNEIYLGQRAYGFAAASQTYFGKPLERLGWAEVAMLVGLPQNPHYANPITNLERATKRQRIVLQRLHDVGLIDDTQLAAARAERLALRAPQDVAVPAGHVAEMARRVVVERYGVEAYTLGLRVHTTLRAPEQQAAVAALQRGLLAHDRKGGWRGPEGVEALPAAGTDPAALEAAAAKALSAYRDDDVLRLGIVLQAGPQRLQVQLAGGDRVELTGEALRWVRAALAPKPAAGAPRLQRGAVVRLLRTPQGTSGWALSQWPQAQGALVALDPTSGRVTALVGGFDFGRSAFNHATQAWRQPGSAFKPLLYSAALEHGYMPASLVDDLPFTAANGWSPQNSDGQFDGALTLREALARSRNLVSVRLAQQLGVGTVRSWAARFGLDPARHPADLTLALGSGSVTPLQLAQAYGVLANGGWRVNPVWVQRITDAQGRTLFEAPPAPVLGEDTRVLPARNVFVTNSLLAEVTRSGTAASAQRRLQRPDLYGKTGTTNDAVDAWFAGFHPQRVAVVWMGHSDAARSLGERESGSALALPVWNDFMAVALRGIAPVPPVVPPGVQQSGEDWMYDEWAEGGWVAHLLADGTVERATGLWGPAAAASAASAAPAPPAAPGPADTIAVPLVAPAASSPRSLP